MAILKEVFINRTYADYFPFYQKAIVVDIGAHFGFFSLFAFKNLAPSSYILSVEPSQSNFEKLSANLEANHAGNVHALQAALSDVDGTSDLFLGRTENHSIFQAAGTAKETVTTLKLETLVNQFELSHIDFLKIDCEGAEYPILLHSPPSAFEKIKTISLEFHDLKDERYTGLVLVKRLEQLNFNIVRFHHGTTHQNKNYGWIVATK